MVPFFKIKKYMLVGLLLLVIMAVAAFNSDLAYAEESIESGRETGIVVENQETNKSEADQGNQVLITAFSSESNIKNNSVSLAEQEDKDNNKTEDSLESHSGLVWDSKGLRYLNEDGSYFCDGWKTVSGKTYFFGDDSYALQWGQTIDGKFYYFDADFSMYTGWLTWKSDGSKSYFGSDGAALTGWQTIDGKRYYFDPENYCHSYLWGHEIDDKFYYFDADGSMYIGLLTWKSDGSKSYFDSDGAALTGWQTIDGKRYYFDENFRLV